MTTGACPECGIDRSTLQPTDTIAALLALPSRYTAALTPLAHAGDGLATRRPSEHVWSATEYTAHAADALRFICERAELILAEDDPELPR
ncbi:MAG: DinB family protein, partial [Actinobacteria bacterium]|nr:DinB family protein [Actinomycetota bacterium]